MSATTVERATENDVADAARIYNRYVRDSTATFHCRTIPDEELAGTLLREAPYGSFVAREENGDLLGYVSLSPYIDRCAARWSVEVAMYLCSKACGRGLGSRLLETAEQSAREHRLHTVVAVICSENAGSCRFFRRHGYRHCGSLEMVAQKFGRRLGVDYYQKILCRTRFDDDEFDL
jgi:phosphinothricin acetyltransferase